AIRPAGFESGPGWPSGGEPMEGPEWPGEWPAAPAGAWPPHDQGPREAGPGAVTRMAGWPQNGMWASEKSSAGGGPDWRWGDWRCGADSWRGRDMRSPPPPPPPPPSPRPPSICISLATISVKYFSTPSWPVYLSYRISPST